MAHENKAQEPVEGFGFQARPLLISGMLCRSATGFLILVDSEQSKGEATIACWHELAHFLVGSDENRTEALAQRLAAACPEVLDLVGISSAWARQPLPAPVAKGSELAPWSAWAKADLAREIQARMTHFYGQTDGSLSLPNSREGDLLKMVHQLLATP